MENDPDNVELFDDEDEDDDIPILLNLDENDEAPDLVVIEHDDSPPIITPCPVTILSGFLGAGKTTLIQYILQSPEHGKRIAVIENEFGEGLNIESMIAKDGSSGTSLQDFIELPNGCVCCTVKDDLITTLETLLERRQELDYILIEASGMANPGPIASLFWLDDALESRLKLDGIVVLVDSYHILEQLQTTVEAAQQIAYADRILLNKVDLVDDTIPMETAIRRINQLVPIQQSKFSQVPNLEWILDANCFDAIGRTNEIDALTAKSKHTCTDDLNCQDCDLQRDLFLPSSGRQHHHTSNIRTLALVKTGSIDLQKMNKWLASLLWPNQDEHDKVLRARLENSSAKKNAHQSMTSNEMHLFRIKGILSIYHVDVMEEDRDFVDDNGVDIRRYIVQAVNDLWEIHPGSRCLQWDQIVEGESAPEGRCCKLILIGRFLQDEQLTKCFESCFDGFERQ